MPRRCLLAVLLVALALPLLAQRPAPPDLSGTWKLNRAASKILTSSTEFQDTIYFDCTGSTFRMNVTADTTDQSHLWVTDGQEHAVLHVEPFASQRGYDLIHIAYWRNATLITEANVRVRTDAGAVLPSPRLATSWTLAKNGRQLFRESGDSKHTLVYDKQ
jgi:hypothetical protein